MRIIFGGYCTHLRNYQEAQSSKPHPVPKMQLVVTRSTTVIFFRTTCPGEYLSHPTLVLFGPNGPLLENLVESSLLIGIFSLTSQREGGTSDHKFNHQLWSTHFPKKLRWKTKQPHLSWREMLTFKGTVARDFTTLVFFIKSVHLGP